MSWEVVFYTFKEWEKEQLQDPQFREAAAEQELAYQITRLRLQRGFTQQQLAERVGTHQSSIARLESGAAPPRLSFLRRVVHALGGKLEIQITSADSPTYETTP
jgi:ribosome-binding protein aMBF1 (putative translation factor)